MWLTFMSHIILLLNRAGLHVEKLERLEMRYKKIYEVKSQMLFSVLKGLFGGICMSLIEIRVK